MSHILYDPTSKLLGSWSLYNEEQDMYFESTLTIARWEVTSEFEKMGQRKEMTVCWFEEQGVLPMWMNTTNKLSVLQATRTRNPAKLVGKQITIYVNERVKSPQGIVPALRVRPITKVAPAQVKVDEQAVKNSIKLLEASKDLEELRACFSGLANSKDVRVRAKADELKLKLTK